MTLYAFFFLLSGDIELNPGPDYKALSVLHLNVRSIRNKLDYVASNLCNFDILCFTETHLTDVVPDNVLTIEGFNTGFHRKDYTPHSSGLLIYVNESLLSRRVIELECPSVHSLWIELNTGYFSALLCCFYRPPNSNVSFWNDLEINIDKALDMNQNVILLGDINEDQLKNYTRLKQSLAIHVFN